MRLLRLDDPGLLRTVAGWMALKENYQWLDFGNGRQILTPEWLAIAAQRDTEILRAFTADDPGRPVGVIGLTNLDRTFRTARIWAVAGDTSFRSRGFATRAASGLLTYGFKELGLGAINTWVVEGNTSVRIVERLGFRYIGRQRACHRLDGEPRDRLWYDLLASEHRMDPA